MNKNLKLLMILTVVNVVNSGDALINTNTVIATTIGIGIGGMSYFVKNNNPNTEEFNNQEKVSPPDIKPLDVSSVKELLNNNNQEVLFKNNPNTKEFNNQEKVSSPDTTLTNEVNKVNTEKLEVSNEENLKVASVKELLNNNNQEVLFKNNPNTEEFNNQEKVSSPDTTLTNEVNTEKLEVSSPDTTLTNEVNKVNTEKLEVPNEENLKVASVEGLPNNNNQEVLTTEEILDIKRILHQLNLVVGSMKSYHFDTKNPNNALMMFAINFKYFMRNKKWLEEHQHENNTEEFIKKLKKYDNFLKILGDNKIDELKILFEEILKFVESQEHLSQFDTRLKKFVHKLNRSEMPEALSREGDKIKNDFANFSSTKTPDINNLKGLAQDLKDIAYNRKHFQLINSIVENSWVKKYKTIISLEEIEKILKFAQKRSDETFNPEKINEILQSAINKLDQENKDLCLQLKAEEIQKIVYLRFEDSIRSTLHFILNDDRELHTLTLKHVEEHLEEDLLTNKQQKKNLKETYISFETKPNLNIIDQNRMAVIASEIQHLEKTIDEMDNLLDQIKEIKTALKFDKYQTGKWMYDSQIRAKKLNTN